MLPDVGDVMQYKQSVEEVQIMYWITFECSKNMNVLSKDDQDLLKRVVASVKAKSTVVQSVLAEQK